MANKTIQSGYMVTIEIEPLTSESNYRTNVFDGLSKEDAAFRLEMGTLMRKNGIGLENVFEPSDQELERAHKKLLDVFAKYPTVFSKENMDYYASDVGAMADTIADMLTGAAPLGFWMRGVSSVKVHRVPEPVIIQDVTSEISYGMQ